MTATAAPLRSATFICAFMLRLVERPVGAQSGGAQLVGDRAAPRSPPVVSTTNTSTERSAAREHALVVARDQRAVEAEGEADAGRRRAAERLDETVVATAATERVLGRVERAAGELERGAPVVVEAAHERGVDRERDAEAVEAVLHRVEVRGRRRSL